MAQGLSQAPAPRIWQVGALCRAVGEALEARFNPVAVRGEISGFSRASSGHCYFALKDEQGQIRCAMFRRAASLLDVLPRDGDVVEVQGRLAVYEPRGDLQLVVESLAPAGQGALFEQFMRLKARLEAEGLFDPQRKRKLPLLPRGIGVITSLGAAALHDVLTALRRRAPHVPVIVSPASVQGSQAPAELVRALEGLNAFAATGAVDVILLVRGGGAIEDLWAFNDEQLARAIVRCPVPVISGVGHETDFTIADFCADIRAPTPTAAAELAVQPLETWLAALGQMRERLERAALRRVDGNVQRLDSAASRLGRPSSRVSAQRLGLESAAHRLRHALLRRLQGEFNRGAGADRAFRDAARRRLVQVHDGLERYGLRLQLLDPMLVLRRGYAWVTDSQGHAVTRAQDLAVGQPLRLQLSQGQAGVTVDRLSAGDDGPAPGAG